MAGRPSSLSITIAKSITNMYVGFVAAVCQWFSVTPDCLKRPGVRPNAPPPSGGFSSLG
jgi:hypothetical protein